MELDRGHFDIALSKFDRALALRKGALPAIIPTSPKRSTVAARR